MTNMRYRRRLSTEKRHALNAICPYFTMFPLEFPMKILRRHSRARVVLDPFCGRGTTLYAGRYHGIRAIGIDCSPVAVAISRAKLSSFSVAGPLALAKSLLSSEGVPDVPQGEFWDLAYHPDTLRDICQLRAGLLSAEDSDTGILLRATMLGVLHGPVTKTGSYLSNQMQRTFSPKPNYAVSFWKNRSLFPEKVDVFSALKRKLDRISLATDALVGEGWRDVHLGDSSRKDSFEPVPEGIQLVITSPPYYGMRTYVADQWLRNWFLGAPPRVDYTDPGDLPSSSTEDFVRSLANTWTNVAAKAGDDIHLFVRFGAIPSRSVDSKRLLLESLEESDLSWKVISIRSARTADAGKRQVEQMRTYTTPVSEIDFHAVLT